jgi:hypothetical protein
LGLWHNLRASHAAFVKSTVNVWCAPRPQQRPAAACLVAICCDFGLRASFS